MGRLIIVSNRVPSPRERLQPAGGLTVGLRDAVRGNESLWFGWSGATTDERDDDPLPSLDVVEGVTYATIDLTARQLEGFYQNFSNGLLWPLCHYRVGLMTYRRSDWETYLEVNALFARVLVEQLQPDDVIWVHDYHLFPLGQALRDLGVTNRIGFFLHIPCPPWSLMRSLPGADLLLRDMEAYDLVGVQTQEDVENMNQSFSLCGIAARAQAFAIGIDPIEFHRQAIASADTPAVRRLVESLHGRTLILGVDRLDYSKGLPERFAGFEAFLERFPQYRGKVTFLQIAPVSRGDVPEYQALRRQLDEQVGRINGVHASYDWTPVRYMTSPVPRDTLAGFYREADIALITPLRDGMNLVAKEYVAAQDPDDPGMLILSHFAGAAPEMMDAVLVNPFDPDEIADALALAMEATRDERIARFTPLDVEVRRSTASVWARDFLKALKAGLDD
ncbi:alpha,alpha-trehalose-phosphate synthase [Ameyamaea chiangmaiensis NBRC 103196]|uniref:Trehalose-6-phosphate synthase n=1 Tax=Ameyamaea chiangmaiensis TaxID=442969 RepID=A0A850P8N2_9PROT|nr:trehalose-6-phosphate synthase [Ameyamaea chiangmaiensis]MBS4075864.1 trehalose-6-phosphate synthase [Ameyamaea chiangmaiensis]NVN40947.1 trehalose-6-phosphate synthase [Ameyamaea chiangmaiensis]GBQ64022.1 alpha,alpha-trehalose-phosphate synthase [Ameyamaea chiangmaiensis NBRC 103196]